MPDLNCPVTGKPMASWDYVANQIYIDKAQQRWKGVEFADGYVLVWVAVADVANERRLVIQRIRIDALPEHKDGCAVFNCDDWDKRRVPPLAVMPLPPAGETRNLSGDALAPRVWLTMSNNGDVVDSFGWELV